VKRQTEVVRTYIKYTISRKEFASKLGIPPEDGEPMSVDVDFRTDMITITMNKVHSES
jgi:hypothetical protein